MKRRFRLWKYYETVLLDKIEHDLFSRSVKFSIERIKRKCNRYFYRMDAHLQSSCYVYPLYIMNGGVV